MTHSPAAKRPRLADISDDTPAEPGHGGASAPKEGAPKESKYIWFQGTHRVSRQRMLRSTVAAYPAALAAIERAPKDGPVSLIAADNASPGLLRHFFQHRKLPAGLSRDAGNDSLWHLERLAKKIDLAELSRELVQLDAGGGRLYDLREKARDTSVADPERAGNYYTLARVLADQADPEAAKKKREKGLKGFDSGGAVLLASYSDALTRYPTDLPLLSDLARVSLAQARAMPVPRAAEAAAHEPRLPQQQGPSLQLLPPWRLRDNMQPPPQPVLATLPAQWQEAARIEVYEKASRFLKAVTQLQPDDVASWKEYAQVSKVLNHVPVATHALRELSRLAPDDADHASQRARYLCDTKQWAEAIPLLQAQVQARSSSGAPWYLLLVYARSGRQAEGIPIAEELVASENACRHHRAFAARMLPMLYRSVGRTAESAAKAVALATSANLPLPVGIQVELASSVKKAGGSVEAIEWLRGLLARVPHERSVLHALARSLALRPESGDEAFAAYMSLSAQPGFNDAAVQQEMQALSRRLLVTLPPPAPDLEDAASWLGDFWGSDEEARDDA